MVPPGVNDATAPFEGMKAGEPAVPRVLTPARVERPKSVMQARRSLLIRILAWVDEYQQYVSSKFKITAYPFQISMDHVEVMHIFQALCDIDELSKSVNDQPNSTIGLQAHYDSRRDFSE